MRTKLLLKQPGLYAFILADISVGMWPADIIPSPVILLVVLLSGIAQGFWALDFVNGHIMKALEKRIKELHLNYEIAIHAFELKKQKYEQALAAHSKNAEP